MPHADLARARAILADLVGFDTTSRNSNLALLDHVEALLHTAGAATWRVPNADGSKANLFARLGPDAPGGVVLSGHTDVVPVDGQAWSSDPFTLTERDGRLYGRGTCDMKGFLACALAAAPVFAAARLERPIIYAFSYDEEVGCLGAPSMIARIVQEIPGAAAVIVGEPSEMKVVTGHKGLASWSVTVEGREVHSSLVHQGACAVSHIAPLMTHLLAEAEAMRNAAPEGSPFEPPYGTITIGRIEGGTAANILAAHARFDSLMRPAPWDDPQGVEDRLHAKAAEVQALMRRTAPEARVIVERRSRVPALAVETDGAAERLARALTGDNARRVVSYGTEGGQFQAAGLSTVICGPGSITEAHQPDEFIEIAQLETCCTFMTKLSQQLTTAPARERV